MKNDMGLLKQPHVVLLLQLMPNDKMAISCGPLAHKPRQNTLEGKYAVATRIS